MKPLEIGSRVASFLSGRARGFRRDDRAQVLVLTAIMAFVTTIMALYTTNASIMIFDRVVAQNAVDAAADSFAAYQARGLNLTQHLNDVHYGVNVAIFVLESAAFVVRILCPAALLMTFPVPCWSCYQTCCRLARIAATTLDDVQDFISDAILVIQDVINRVFPVMAALSANDIARANGADNLVAVAGELLGRIGDFFGINLGGLQAGFDAIADFVPVYAFPLDPGQIIDLGMEKRDPDWLFWDDMSILFGLGLASDIACALSGDQFVTSNEPNDGLGWEEDEYYCGGPDANTWFVGKRRRTVASALVNIPWLNPRMDAPDQEFGFHAFEDDYARFRSQGEGTSDFNNPAMFAVASSQVGGKVVIDRTILGADFDGDEDYGHPQLITVQIPAARFLFIWH